MASTQGWRGMRQSGVKTSRFSCLLSRRSCRRSVSVDGRRIQQSSAAAASSFATSCSWDRCPRPWHAAASQTQTLRFSSSSSTHSANIGVGVDTNHAKKSDAFDQAREGMLAPCIILVRPSLDQNVGTTARAMLNFGLWDLRLVDPECNHLSENAFARASGAEAVLSRARVCTAVFASVEEAVQDLHRVYATTARIRAFVTKMISAEEAGREAATAESEANTDLRLVDRLVQIPTLQMFSSLNLAQAVNVMAYESWKARERERESVEGRGRGGREEATGEREGESEGDARGILTQLEHKGGRASKQQLDCYLRRLETALEHSNFKPKGEKRAMIFRQLGIVYSRADLASSEVNLLHGILTSLIKPHAASGSRPDE